MDRRYQRNICKIVYKCQILVSVIQAELAPTAIPTATLRSHGSSAPWCHTRSHAAPSCCIVLKQRYVCELVSKVEAISSFTVHVFYTRDEIGQYKWL